MTSKKEQVWSTTENKFVDVEIEGSKSVTESWLEKPETKELLKRLEERAKEQREIDVEIIRIISSLLGNLPVQRREDIHPYSFELSVGAKMFEYIKELVGDK